MEPANSTSTPTAARVRRLIFKELSGSPSPTEGEPGVKVFQARRFWKSNVCGVAAASVGAAGLFIIIGGILVWGSQHWEGRLWGVGLILSAIVAFWALVPGNLAAVYPYAVEIEEGKGLRFYAPFKQFYVSTREVKLVKWSWFWAGWVVRLRERRGLLVGFIIHAAWSQQGRELVQAIGEELIRSA
jgi:hypothetical protein